MKRIGKIVLCIALVISLGGGIILSAFPLKARAETISYSNVLDDLKKDPSFDPDDYPAVANDYSLKVIQIAESENGELFVYVYQPSVSTKMLVATSIVFSDEKDILKRVYEEYSLNLVSVDGVFHKYKVLDYTVSDASEREYSISTIRRAFDSNIDPDAPAGNTISYKGITVGQLWKVNTTSDGISYSCEYEDTVLVTSLYIGEIKYQGKSPLLYIEEGSIYSHYVAFSTDHNIDTIIDADVVYSASLYSTLPSSSGLTTNTTSSVLAKDKRLTVSKADIISGKTEGLISESYNYSRIQSVKEFISNEEGLFSEAKEALSDKQWVFRFLETSYEDSLVGNYNDASGFTTYTGKLEYTKVTDVGILRLKFVYNGDVYNLGVVSDKQSSDGLPDNSNSPLDGVIDNFEEIFQNILSLIGLIVFIIFVAFLFPLIKNFGGFIWSLIKNLFSGFIWLIVLPFRILDRLFK